MKPVSESALLYWTEHDTPHSARWQSESGQLPPRRVVLADDSLSADTAWRLACEGTALLWRGGYYNARQLLQAMARRASRKPRRKAEKAAAKAAGKTAHKGQSPGVDFPEAFHLHRMAQAQRARTLGMLLIPVEAGGLIPLRRAPDVAEALSAAFGEASSAGQGNEQAGLLQAPFVLSLRELLGLIGAHEWRRQGVLVPALGARIHPHYGVFSPLRGEYLDLIARARLPATTLAFDIGTMQHREQMRRDFLCAEDHLDHAETGGEKLEKFGAVVPVLPVVDVVGAEVPGQFAVEPGLAALFGRHRLGGQGGHVHGLVFQACRRRIMARRLWRAR